MSLETNNFETQARLAVGNLHELRRYLTAGNIPQSEAPQILDQVLEYADKAEKLIRIWASKNNFDIKKGMQT